MDLHDVKPRNLQLKSSPWGSAGGDGGKIICFKIFTTSSTPPQSYGQLPEGSTDLHDGKPRNLQLKSSPWEVPEAMGKH